MRDALGTALGLGFGVAIACVVGAWVTVLPALGLLWLLGVIA